MNLASILLWGFVGTVVLTTTMAGSQWLGHSRMSLPFVLGTMLTPDHDRARVLGFFFHLVNGWLFAFIYALGFQGLGLANAWIGAAGGLLHGLFVLVAVLPLLPSIHPRMATERQGPTPTRRLQPPGFLGLHYGSRTPIIEIVAHVAYGAVLGGFYRLA